MSDSKLPHHSTHNAKLLHSDYQTDGPLSAPSRSAVASRREHDPAEGGLRSIHQLRVLLMRQARNPKHAPFPFTEGDAQMHSHGDYTVIARMRIERALSPKVRARRSEAEVEHQAARNRGAQLEREQRIEFMPLPLSTSESLSDPRD